MRLGIWLPGQPSRVTHQSGTRHTRNGRSYKTQALKLWENELRAKLDSWVPDEPITGPIRLHVTFGYLARRKKDAWKWKLTRPDTDNAIKTVKDVMTGLKFWNDDSQVVWETCKKMWVPADPGIVITLEVLPGTAEEWGVRSERTSHDQNRED